VNPWVEAARPRTLVAGVVPVLVGTSAADRFFFGRLIAALIVAIAIQVGVNYANDYFDALKGVDRPDRIGPRRATATGLISPARMRAGIAACIGAAVVAGLYLSALAGWHLVAVGALCFAALLGYSGGARPYGASGLGEVFVFLFFGVVATTGSAYVQSEHLQVTALAASVPVGALATAILVVNNLRDIGTDKRAGKLTLAARIGPHHTQRLYVLLVAAAFVSLTVIALVAGSIAPLAAWASLPLALKASRLVGARNDAGVIAALGATARLQLVFGTLLAAGLWIS